MTKLIVILGATGTQGSSVVNSFLGEPSWKIRAVTRSPTSSTAKALSTKGIEVVKADVNDPASLVAAFQGANAIFAVTDFWGTFHTVKPEDLEPGQYPGIIAKAKEFQAAKNIMDAAATIVDAGLERFIWSGLSQTSKWSKGKYTWNYHFDGKAEATEYMKEKLPNLAAKASIIQIGFYASNMKLFESFRPKKQSDGTYLLIRPCPGDSPLPFIVTHKDTGPLVKALITQLPPGKNLLAYSEMMTYDEYIALWAKVVGVTARGKQCTIEEYDRMIPGGVGRETGESASYATEFGYDGGDPEVTKTKDVSVTVVYLASVIGLLTYRVQLGVEVHLTKLEDYFREEDWSDVLG
ncbi:MAG: hypothetical protein M1834_009632 [Cirrosporium novae-zelandiae]|nr:MAG: hypothetical protein M1834_009632 [Cirrosporium novae-zelandiae]